MDYARILEDLIQKNESVYKIELLFDEMADFKSATAAKIFKELKNMYEIIFTIPDLNSEDLDENRCDYRFFLKGEVDLHNLKDFMDGLIESESGIDTFFIQEVLMEDIKQAVGDDSIGHTLPESKIAGDSSLPGWEAVEKEGINSVRIDIGKLDILSNLAAELVACKAQIAQVLTSLKRFRNTDKALRPVIEHFEKGVFRLERLSFDLQEQVTQLRMFPLKTIFRKIPRIVRELAARCGKEVELVIKGEDTELDKVVLEQISDPLVHLIRNCVDHGIETGEERISKGKPPKGRIRINAYTEGDIVYIEVEDDGKGIDIEKIKEKVIENGLAAEEDVEQMNKEEIIDYIFRPSFSTSEEVNEVSGRGVGMDVVRRNISLVKGDIRVESKKDCGTKFILQIPLTVAIIKSLLVSVNGSVYLLPIDRVIETFKTTEKDIKRINGNRILSWNGDVVPVFDLGEMLGLDEKGDEAKGLYAVIIQHRSSKVGITVNRLLGEIEAVVKPLDKYIGLIEGIMGATVLGDGKIVLILEPVGLIDRAAG
ncbi:MAG: chemotaxis protein CheA [Firmicutes bacterium]|nr:chemotaxis protein CheA [Bacillota bacterium]